VNKPAKPTTESPKDFIRRDATGHLSPKYEKDLIELAKETHGDDEVTSPFVTHPKSKDALAERLGEDVVQAATSGEQGDED